MTDRILPDRKRMEDFADSMIKLDSLVGPSIADGYMTRDEYVISTWTNYFCNENCPSIDGFELEMKAWRALLPEAYEAASKLFEVTPQKAKELFERAMTIRSRNSKRSNSK